MAHPVLDQLFDRIRETITSERNCTVNALWALQPETARDHWRGMPRVVNGGDPVPYTIQPEMPFWSQLVGFDLAEFYTNPHTYLEYQLRMLIFRHERFPDFTVVGTEVPIWLGVPFEPSFFGQGVVLSSRASPWIGRRQILRRLEDIERLRPPNFHHDGLMPTAHRYYEEIGELLPEDFSVIFPDWGRSPFAVALHLRGMNELPADMLSHPEFTARLIGFITDCRKEWSRQRAAFLDQPLSAGNLYNDECNCPTISPRLYEKFVLPGESDLSAFYGGIAYWHSCGDTTQLVPFIARIPNLSMFHVGPWTNIEAVVAVLPQHVALEVCIDPVADLQMATPEQMRDRLHRIRAACDGRAYTVRADGIQLLHSMEQELSQMDAWLDAAREVLGTKDVIS